MCVKWNLVSVHFEIVLVSVQDRCTILRRMYLGHGNHFGHTRSYSYVTLAKRKLVSVRLEIVLISTHDRCMVCAEHRKGLEIILGATEGTPT